MNDRTHIILVNWNGGTDTVECLESLLRLKGEFVVTVCDNGSADRSIERIVAWAEGPQLGTDWSPLADRLGPARLRSPTFRICDAGHPAGQTDNPPFLTIVKNGANLGFAGGNNVGVNLALADPRCAYIWLLNNDTVVAEDALIELQARMNDPGISVCGSTLLFYDAPETVQALGSAFDLARALGRPIGLGGHASALPSQAEVEVRLAYVVGASLMARRELMARTGGLSEDYFLYFEEIDLSRRLAPAERMGWAPRSIVYHKEGGSIGTSSRHRPSPTSVYYLRVNLLRFYRRYHPALLPIALARVARESLKDLGLGDNAALRASAMAIGDFLTGRRRVGPISVATAAEAKTSG